MALESFPPLLLVALRYLLSGSIMLAGAALMRIKLPTGKELWQTAGNGVAILGVGNGCLAFAEQWIPSGLAALFITTAPFWMVTVEALIPGGASLYAPTVAGMVIGFSGVALLISPSGMGGVSSALLAGFLLLQLGCAGWSLGSSMQRRTSTVVHPMVSGAVQQLATGIVYVLPAILFSGHPIHWTTRGTLALAYLVVFGSIVGYSAYIYALSSLPVAIVSIYNYINPIVAVFLGWLFYREAFGVREAVAMCVIFVGVAIVKKYSPKPAVPEPETEQASA